MNKRQKLVQEQFLNNEEAVIKRLKTVYNQSLKDINGKISDLDSSIEYLQKVYNSIQVSDGNGGTGMGGIAFEYFNSKGANAAKHAALNPEEAKKTVASAIQSKVYQKNFQAALQKQVGGILDTMHEKEFKTVSDYLKKSYEDGFIGTMFDLQGQGIPMCFPLDQEAMVRAVQLDSKISQGLYSRLGEDVALLKKKITAQVSRGISTGMTFQQVAQQLAGYTNIGFNNAVRIARTEGHRIQVQSAMDACYKAKDKGADVVKQWDSTLDDSTRESHQAVDGEIRELDKSFSNGLMFPGDPSGGAAEVINCRCALLQRAKWALDEEELKVLQDRASFYGLDKAETFEDYKKTYLKAAEEIKKQEAKKKFIPAKDMKEAKTRFSKVLGIPEEKINLGRMKPELANQYLEGVEMFMDDFPMLKGFYGTLGTKTGGKNTLGVNKLKGTYETIHDVNHVRYSAELHFKNPSDLSKMMDDYAWISDNSESYENCSPLSTAIHELVHGIDHAITLKKHGAYDENGLGVTVSGNHGLAIAGISRKVIQQAREELFGRQFGKEVAEKTRYLGKYARSSPKEELAEAISYEYVNQSNPYSARILELFKEQVKGAFGE